jgi:hypothetical protein
MTLFSFPTLEPNAMLQMNQERYHRHNRGRVRRVRHDNAAGQDRHGLNGYAVFWTAMIAAVVLLWYTVISLLLAEGATSIPPPPAVIGSAPSAHAGRSTNPSLSPAPAYAFHLQSHRQAHQAAPA